MHRAILERRWQRVCKDPGRAVCRRWIYNRQRCHGATVQVLTGKTAVSLGFTGHFFVSLQFFAHIWKNCNRSRSFRIFRQAETLPVGLPQIAKSLRRVSSKTKDESGPQTARALAVTISNFAVSYNMGMDQYLLIPFLVGWTSIYQLFWCSPGVQGFDTLPHVITYNIVWQCLTHILLADVSQGMFGPFWISITGSGHGSVVSL